MNDFLKLILANKQAQIRLLHKNLDRKENQIDINKNKKNRSLATALVESNLSVIAEIKRNSPAKGFLSTIEDPGLLAHQYVKGGAAAISVLTESHYFQGTHADLQQVKQSVGDSVPILRKDFIIDPIQLLESLMMNADVVLLIAHILQNRLKEFIHQASRLGIETIVEIHNAIELELALESGANIIGINNRNLSNFSVSLDVAFNLIQRIPQGVLTIAESGISDPAQAKLFHQAGFNGVLIGEALVTSSDPARFIQACI